MKPRNLPRCRCGSRRKNWSIAIVATGGGVVVFGCYCLCCHHKSFLAWHSKDGNRAFLFVPKGGKLDLRWLQHTLMAEWKKPVWQSGWLRFQNPSLPEIPEGHIVYKGIPKTVETGFTWSRVGSEDLKM